MSSDDLSKFLEAKIKFNPRKQRRTRKGFPPPSEYDEYDFNDEKLRQRETNGIENQFVETHEILSNKTITSENETFYELYTKAKTSEYEVKDLLQRLKANVVAYIDRKYNGLLVSGSLEKIDKLSEKSLPKYITNRVRIIKPITKDEQIEEEIPNGSEIKMLIFSIIPNLNTIKNKIYIQLLEKYFSERDCKMYGNEFQKFGFILADVTSLIIGEIISKSAFIFKINLIPDAIANEIRKATEKTESVVDNNQETNKLANPHLPNVVLMDSGVNLIPSILPVLHSRNAYMFQDLNDGHNNNGHGTPIANLIAYGENNQTPNSNIISYKIWASNQIDRAQWGFFRGIEEYASNENRLFVTSIGVPHFPKHLLVKLDALIQQKNICFVASAGNVEPEDISKILRDGGQYPDYLRDLPVIAPANAVNVVAVGSFAKKTHPTFQSIARSGEISPHSRCGCGAYGLFECKRPQVVEHGGNVNVIDDQLNVNDEDVGVETINRQGNNVSMSGSSFSSPLFVRRLAGIQRVYRTRIKNAETFLAISYLSCVNNFNACAGFGAPSDFTHCGHNSALYYGEGEICFTQVSDDTITLPINDIIVYIPPNVNEIKFCLTHSDDLYKAVIPTLETFFEIKTSKTGREKSYVEPINRSEIDSKTNTKILVFRYDRSMEGWWTFSIRPRLTNDILSEDKRNITVRFGCAVLLNARSDRRSNKSLTQEIIENMEKYS